MSDAALELLSAIQGKRIVVAGDYVLDRYIFGRPSRLSREAPVLILEHESEEQTPGGAGNATRNVHALGGRPIPIGVVGSDAAGDRLLEIFEEAGIERSGIVRDPSRATVAKTRILAGGVHSSKQQVLRIDRGHRDGIGTQTRARLLRCAAELSGDADGVLLSDYGYSTLFPELSETLLASASARGLPSCADSRFQLLSFAGVTIATPNEEEASAVSGSSFGSDDEAARAGERLRETLRARALLLTRGSRGMWLFLAGGERHELPVIGPDEVADVTGAGDTVAGAIVLGLAAGGEPLAAARLANAAASVVVMKRGAATTSVDEVSAALARERRGKETADEAAR